MDNQLTQVIRQLGTAYEDVIEKGSRIILEVDLGREAEKMGFDQLGHQLRGVEAVIPVKKSVDGMKVLIDGRTFVGYREYGPGIAVPGHVAGQITLPASPYVPADSLVRQFH
jgi:hypothetical protein